MMRARYLVLALVLLGADAAPPAGGTIEGSVLVIAKSRGTSKVVKHDDVYVYLEPLDAKASRGALPGTGKQFQIKQVGERFVPRVLVVPVGATVWFPNLDKQVHNVFSPTEPAFDLGRYKTDQRGKSHTFQDEDEFDIFCDIHQEMWAKVKAVPSQHIAKVEGGKFRFANIPAGRYRVVAWVRNSPESRFPKQITVTPGGTVKLDRDLHVQLKRPSGCHSRLDGGPYVGAYSKCPDDY